MARSIHEMQQDAAKLLSDAWRQDDMPPQADPPAATQAAPASDSMRTDAQDVGRKGSQRIAAESLAMFRAARGVIL